MRFPAAVLSFLALLALLLAPLAGCGGGDEQEASPPELATFREAYGSERWGAAAEAAGRLLERGVDRGEVLLAMAEASRRAGRLGQLEAILARLMKGRGDKGPGARQLRRCWQSLGYVCGLRGEPGPFLEVLAARTEDQGSEVAWGLGALVAMARVAGKGVAMRSALLAEAERRGGDLGEVLRAWAPAAGTDWDERQRAALTPGDLLNEARFAGLRGEYRRCRDLLGSFLAEVPQGDPRRILARRLDVQAALAAGGADLAELRKRAAGTLDELRVLRCFGHHDEALAWLEEHRAKVRLFSGEKLRVLREAGRVEQALALLDEELRTGDLPRGIRPSQLRLARARVLMEGGRWEEAATALEQLGRDPRAFAEAGAEVLLWSAVAAALQARRGAARDLLQRALAVFPLGGHEFRAWTYARFLSAPPEQERAIAFEWTRFPDLRDNDRAFFEGLKRVIAGDTGGAREALQRCSSLSLGGEYPRRLAAAALTAPALAAGAGR